MNGKVEVVVPFAFLRQMQKEKVQEIEQAVYLGQMGTSLTGKAWGFLHYLLN